MAEIVPILILEFIVDYALSEITEHMMKAGCGWSKKKWRKIMKRINNKKQERPQEIARRLSELPNQHQVDIMDYVKKIDEEITKSKVLKQTEI